MAKPTGEQLIKKAGKYHTAGKYAQAEKIYRQLLKSNPNDLTLLRILGILERDRKNLRAAIDWFMIAKQVSGDDPIILAELALTLEQGGKSEKAMQFADEAHHAKPDNIDIAIFYARMCLSRGLASRAGNVVSKAIDSDPENHEAWHMLSIAANSSGTLPVPLEFATRYVQLEPKEAKAHATLATAHRLNGNLEQSLSSYEHALSIESMNDEAIAGKAEILESLGRTKDADQLLQTVPRSNSILITLAKVRIARRLNKFDDALQTIDQLIDQPLSASQRSNLFMHRGRVLEELKRYDEAWKAWGEANKLHAGNFNLQSHVEIVDNIINTTIPSSGISDNKQPIFIVGMFRSGTTLLEQILGAHPEIDSAGEVNQLLHYVKDKPYPDCLDNTKQEWSQEYLQRLNSKNTFCTDKFPMNYLHIGLIHTLFPNATILHTTRNPLDTCVSCYANSFAATHAYTSNLSDLAGVYKQYLRVMSHWNEILPNRIHEVNYESLVENLEVTIKNVLAHIGVSFDPACLEFYNIQRIAVTPSADQVRKPIYTSSIHRHKHFASQLGELNTLK